MNLEVQFLVKSIKQVCEPTQSSELQELDRNATLDWEKVYNLAQQHQVRPLLLKALTLYKIPSMPEDFFNKLKKICQQLAIRCLANASELTKILSVLKNANILAIPYKGCYFSNRYFGSLTHRETIDIDLFVYQSDVYKLINVFKLLNYNPIHPLNDTQLQLYLEANNDYIFIPDKGFNKGGVQVEPHYKSNITHYGSEFTLADLTLHIQHKTFQGIPIQVFDDNAQLLLLLTHHGVKEGWAKLKYLSDIYIILQHNEYIDWHYLLKETQRLDMQINMLVGFALLETLFNYHFPAIIVELLQQPKVIMLKQDRLNKISEEKLNNGYFDAWVFNLKSRSRWQVKAKIVLSVLFKPSAGDIATFQLPKYLYFLYYLIRPFRLMQLYLTNKFV